jgi:hypothetical protein
MLLSASILVLEIVGIVFEIGGLISLALSLLKLLLSWWQKWSEKATAAGLLPDGPSDWMLAYAA